MFVIMDEMSSGGGRKSFLHCYVAGVISLWRVRLYGYYYNPSGMSEGVELVEELIAEVS